jgi:ABC-type multidrug transport system fused ATPase/permease subunit
VTLRVFWSCWLVASVTTGLVAGFMLGYALILGRFLDWILATDPRLLASTYPTFAGSAGRGGLTVFYAVCGLQVVAALALLALALIGRRHRLGATIAALAAVLWPTVHYASGFGALEAVVLRSPTWNAPVHAIHAVLLVVGLLALLAMRITAGPRRPDR